MIRIGILGYGNLGRGVECAVKQNDDMELAAVFTRRNPESVSILTEHVPVCPIADLASYKDRSTLQMWTSLQRHPAKSA